MQHHDIGQALDQSGGSFIDQILWPEFIELKAVLDEYLDQVTERIIREEIFSAAEEAEDRGESAAS